MQDAGELSVVACDAVDAVVDVVVNDEPNENFDTPLKTEINRKHFKHV